MTLEFRTFQMPNNKWLLLDQHHNTYGGEFDTEAAAWDWLRDDDEG